MAEKLCVIEKVEDLIDNGKIIGRLITDKAGDTHKVKSGQGGKLKDRWEQLDNSVGKAIKFIMGKYKDYPFVADFEFVSDIMAQEAITKTQESQTSTKDMSVCLSYAKDMAVVGLITKEEILQWATRFHTWLSISNAYKEASSELNKQPSGKDEQPDRPDTDSETLGQLSLEETREQRERIQQLATNAKYNKPLWEAFLKVNYVKTDLTKFSQEELNKLEEQLKEEAK